MSLPSSWPTQREWEALFKAAFRTAEAEGMEVTEIAAGDVRVSLRLKTLAKREGDHVERWKRGESARGKARPAA